MNHIFGVGQSNIITGNGIPFILSSHPRGSVGAQKSLNKVVEFIARDRIDPRTRAWSINELQQAGNPQNDYDRARVIYNAVKRDYIYVPDPFDAEFMQSAVCTLDNCNGVAFHGGDCDDLSITYGSAIESVGLRAAVIGHSYRPDKEITHVLIGFWDDKSGQWIPVDPSTNIPFGTTYRYTREIWLDIPSGRIICDSDVCDRHILPPDISEYRKKGDFVGVVPFNQMNDAVNDSIPNGNYSAPVDSIVIKKKSIVLFSVFTVLSGIGTALYLSNRDKHK